MSVGRFRSESGRAEFTTLYEQAMAELPPRETLDLPTSFGTVRAYRFGAGDQEPLVLLPGKASSTPLWSSNLPTLLPLGAVIALDLLGEPGMSVQTASIASAADQAHWLTEALDQLDIAKAHLLGVSFGGWIAVNLAIHSPNRVLSLALLDPVNTFGRIGLKTIAFSLGAAIPAAPDWLRKWSLRWISGGESADASAMGRLIACGMKQFQSRLPMPGYPTDGDLRGIISPALVVIAGRSIIHNPVKAEARAHLLPNAHVELWPDATHALNGEFPERVADRVRDLLGST